MEAEQPLIRQKDINRLEESYKKIGLNVVGLKYALVACYILYFALNFIGHPAIKYNYVALLFIHIALIVLFDPEEAITALVALSFIEGQGRIIWGYNAIFRIMFDICLFFIVMKIILMRRKLLSSSVIPLPVRAFILMHFLWFALELFNLLGAGPLVALATAKYYVFPFLLFFAFTLIDLADTEYMDKRISLIVTLLVVASASLCIYQMKFGESFMYNISGHYQGLFAKFKEFSGGKFRPWGTTHTPGGQSLYLFLTLGFVFICLGHLKSSLKYIVFVAVLALTGFALFINNVRSAFIKHILIFIGCSLVYFFSSRKKVMSARNFVFTFVIALIVAIPFIQRFDQLVQDLNLENTLSRLKEINEEGVAAQRGGPELIYRRIIHDTEWPFGFGPGMTTGYLPEFQKRRQEIVGIPEYLFWSGDNLILFLFLELGIGALFYIMVVILNVLYLGQMTLKLYMRQQRDEFQLVGICFISVLVITVGQWGVVGIPFNPESFFYWLWVAVGYTVYRKAYVRYLKEQMATQQKRSYQLDQAILEEERQEK